MIVIVTTGASCVGELLKVNNSLQELDMGYNPIGDDGMSSVADGLQCNNTLTKLNVHNCEFSVKGTTWFARFIIDLLGMVFTFCFSYIESCQKILRFRENRDDFGIRKLLLFIVYSVSRQLSPIFKSNGLFFASDYPTDFWFFIT